jgi:hypothetical protein
MSDQRWVRTIVMGIVLGNLVVLAKFFLIPRMQFFPVQPGLTKQLMETTGPSDMPNQLGQTYRVVNRIKELIPMNATVFMPPGDRLEGSFRSATTQFLYPRKLFFGESENFERELKEAKNAEAVYFVYSPDWRPDFCEEPSRIELTDSGFGMCRLAR